MIVIVSDNDHNDDCHCQWYSPAPEHDVAPGPVPQSHHPTDPQLVQHCDQIQSQVLWSFSIVIILTWTIDTITCIEGNPDFNSSDSGFWPGKEMWRNRELHEKID